MVSRETKLVARDANGRLLPGHASISPGRPRRAVEQDYLRALSDACPLELWREICARAVADAREGDWRAREWLGKYLVGTEVALQATLSREERHQLHLYISGDADPSAYYGLYVDMSRRDWALAQLEADDVEVVEVVEVIDMTCSETL